MEIFLYKKEMFLWFCKLFISESESEQNEREKKLILRSEFEKFENCQKLANIRIPITYLCSNQICKEFMYYSIKTAKEIKYICPGCTRMLCRT